VEGTNRTLIGTAGKGSYRLAVALTASKKVSTSDWSRMSRPDLGWGLETLSKCSAIGKEGAVPSTAHLDVLTDLFLAAETEQ
jgi:hypothetical protein